MPDLENTIPDGWPDGRTDGEAGNRTSYSPVGAGTGVVGELQLMFVYDFIPLVGCGGPSGAGNSTLSSCS